MKRPPPEGELPIAYSVITKNIQAFLDRTPRGTQTRLAISAGIQSQDFSHRMTEYRGERFTYEQLGAMAKEAGAPTGWPLISWEEAAAFDAFRKLAASHSPKHR